MIFEIAVAPVAAELPSESPFPPDGVWYTLWEILQDLQDQINNVPDVAIKSGVAQHADSINVPSGFSVSQCGIHLSPRFFDCDDISCPFHINPR